ncbi:alpha/beta fold hydrolase [Sphingosinicella rhizophila]|uniref:Alpha/beta hydrolase n=1 Tax=Sphingosinicella rhizophila TaxID=3050082 RepID=A0ABU3Q4P6_9SPHN|nr:alpha/beta hydrolase [Sphingosinicella sp. GR2756]MDT9598379.1 alpha/beta hydrolase [Sphingosinicella sp. GR2756]
MRLSICLALALLLPALCIAAPSSASAQEARQVMERVGTLTAKDAIDEKGLVTIGGIEQWVSVRGRHRSNPILLVLHGGPGFTLSPVSYWYMRDWEEYFTVVQWDQRGAGKTYAANDPASVRPTMSVKRMVDDAEELILHLRRTYGKDRVVLLAHSFGTILGVELAQRRHDLLYAYVGTGQFIDSRRSERMGFEATLAAARAAGDAEAVAELTAIAPFPDPVNPARNLQNLGKERKWLAKYGGYYRAGGVGHNGEIASLSPDFTADELKTRDEAQWFSLQAMWGELGTVSFSERTTFRTPVIILQGRHDLGTSSTLVAEWFPRVKAPVKKLVWFEDSAHMVHEEEPGKLLVTLVEQVLPLTRRK